MTTALWILKAGTSLCMLSFGLNQITNPKSWAYFIPDWLKRSSPISDEYLIRLHSLGNIIFGIFLVLGIYPHIAAWVALVWWISILPFAFGVDWTLGMRDLAVTAGLIALVLLTR